MTKAETEAYVAEMKVWIQQEELRKQSCIRARTFYAEQIKTLEQVMDLEDQQRAIIQVGIDLAWYHVGEADDAQKREEAGTEEDSAKEDAGTGCPECDGCSGAPEAAQALLSVGDDVQKTGERDAKGQTETTQPEGGGEEGC